MLVGSDHFQELPAYGSYMGGDNSDQSVIAVTYTELTPLQPLSPLKTDHDPAYMVGSNSLHCYEHLEPLKPTAMLGDDGQFQLCSQSNFGGHLRFLPPVDSLELQKILWSENAVNRQCSETSNHIVKVPILESDVGNSPTASGPSTPTHSVNLCADNEEIDTYDVAERVSAELRRYNIPQALFAQTVLSRSQGTLSELLRNPKPWSKMKTGRETYVRMLQWLREPESQRMAVLRRAGTFYSIYQHLWLKPGSFLCHWL